jgi:predicted transcriptional regulator
MPISREAFEKGLDPGEEKIINFLRTHSDSAFTSEEIADSLDWDTSNIAGAMSLTLSLIRLIFKGFINSKRIGRDIYYTYQEVKQEQRDLLA